ncbi:hypothetical protein [Tenacibaculum maritimum]|uniref:hypothetical protein n=1 Tax=Tenacibaculum maritimum TaxID=107401 RepID=UPI0010A2C03F|nr:hypothetical protein [Tenacibaculum maritimum]
MKKNKYCLIIIICFWGNMINAQNTVQSILEAYTKALQENKSYKVAVMYKIYKGHLSTIPEEVKTGVFYKDKKKSYTKIEEVEIINTPKIHVKINHGEKAILVADGIDSPKEARIDLKELLKYFEAKIVEEKMKYWKLIFIPKGKITQVPFSKLNVYLEKGSYNILKQEFYYYTTMNFSSSLKSSDLAKVKLETSFKNYKEITKKELSDIFEISKYISMNHKKIKPSLRYKNYEIVVAKR